jgi:hypothetical protein
MPFLPVIGVGSASAINTGVQSGLNLLSDAASVAAFFLGPQWGIFSHTGNPLLISDSVRAVDYREEANTPTYNYETGGFANYNKVTLPYDVRITFMNGGAKDIAGGLFGLNTGIIPGFVLFAAADKLISGQTPQQQRRQDFIRALQDLKANTTLIQVVTPELTMLSGTVVGFEYRRQREDGGASLIPVDVHIQEVRVSAQVSMSQTEQPQGAAAQPQGDVQPQAPTPAQASTVNTSPPPAAEPDPAGSMG